MSLVEEFLECGPEDLLLPDADCILFMNVPGRDRTQQWHRDMRWAGEGGDYSEEGQRVRWQEIQEAAKTSPCGHNGYFEDHGGSYFRWALSLIDNIGTGLEIGKCSRSLCVFFRSLKPVQLLQAREPHPEGQPVSWRWSRRSGSG